MKKTKPTNRKISALETKKKIYEVADRLFQKYGFDNVSVDSIVEKAGVSKGTFYVHFDSKNSLIAAVIADFVDNVDLDYRVFFESLPESTTASDMLLSLVEKVVDVMTCKIGYDLIKVVYEGQIARTINTDALLSYNRDIYQLFSKIISKGKQQGEFKTEIPLDTITNHCILTLRGFAYEWCIRYPDFNYKDQVLKHFEILLTGIKSSE